MNPEEKQKILHAGKIASQLREYAKEIVKKGMLLLELAEKIESKIFELGAKPAFPVNLSINEIAAHYTPKHDDKTLAYGLLKIDIGVHIDGYIADTALSFDLENKEENKTLISASEKALENTLKLISSKNKNTNLHEIGKTIQETIESYNASPIVNLTGHSIEKYNLHSGISVPNIKNNNNLKLGKGVYAIEPFATFGNGKVHDGPDSGIFQLISEKNIRNPLARKILKFIKQEYDTLPFCSRWIVKKFGTKSLFALKQLEQNNNLHQFSQLIEISEQKVAQAEHTILILDGEMIATTKND